MSWWKWITGGTLGAVTETAERVTGIWRPNSEKGAERSHTSDMAILEQFSTEFRKINNRTAWDSAVDGINRLPRPLLTLSILGLFILAPFDPIRFHKVALAYEAMPEGFWALLSIIVSFFFGGRIRLTGHQFAVKGGALEAAKRAVKAQSELAKIGIEEEPNAGVDLSGIENKVVRAWLSRGSR